MQKAVKEKRDSFKEWQSSRTTEDLADYRENKTNAKKAVTTAKDAGYEELYTKLNSRERQDMIILNWRKLDTGEHSIRKILCISESSEANEENAQ